ncbi:MAG: UDP-N-acetylmuramoyl-tripeptide--D-alanyl-D-alanine ligase [bacterium]|nr:UDP-N-acetylmuramoyl-tripeptide--D-alanyl-D-alanine ligase [bacterium]
MNTKFTKWLAWFARKIVAKHNPQIIGVTGSVGKTSTRHAIATVLATKYKVREPIKNYNNQIGIPLTIIGAKGLDDGGGKLGWLRIFAQAAKTLWFTSSYPKILVLEYGIDHPGDMDELLKIVQPTIAVLTTIGISHREHFNTEAEIAVEKGKMAAGLPVSGMFIYNADDVHVAEQSKRTQAKLLSYGTGSADIVLETVEEVLSLAPQTRLHIKTPTRILQVTIPVVGMAHEAAVLAAVAIAEALEVETDLILRGLANYRPVPGRLNILPGIKRTILIDDTYNAAPLSMMEALHLLHRYEATHKIAVLGDMLELGDLSQKAHADIGELVASMKISKLITVGELGKIIAATAVEKGMKQELVQTFNTSDEARLALQEILDPESVVLIKGSQGVRMEKVTKEVMAEPMSAPHVLCRQYGKWLE